MQSNANKRHHDCPEFSPLKTGDGVGPSGINFMFEFSHEGYGMGSGCGCYSLDCNFMRGYQI